MVALEYRMKPFSYVVLTEPNTMQKMLNKLPPENAIKELINTLASKTYSNISTADLEGINKKYQFDVTDKFKDEVIKLYKDFVTFHLNTNFPNEDSIFIPGLSKYLRIDMEKAGEIYAEVACEVYRNNYQVTIKDRRLSEEDDKKLEKLWKDLRFPEDYDITKMSGDIRQNAIQSYINNIIADGELSPEEEHELEQAAISLKVNMNFDENTKQALDKMRKVWQLNHGELPILMPDIILPKNETCYYIQYADLFEYRKVGGKIAYAGPTLRIKIAKGLYTNFRVKSY